MERDIDSYLRVIGNEMAKYEKSYARGQISSWTGALQGMARILSSVEGRKHVVLFSEGFDGRLLFGRQPDFFDEEMQREQEAIDTGQYGRVDTDNRYGNTQLLGQVNRMLNEFQRANTVIHTVDNLGPAGRPPGRTPHAHRAPGRPSLHGQRDRRGTARGRERLRRRTRRRARVVDRHIPAQLRAHRTGRTRRPSSAQGTGPGAEGSPDLAPHGLLHAPAVRRPAFRWKSDSWLPTSSPPPRRETT